jgi:hypothetical protein
MRLLTVAIASLLSLPGAYITRDAGCDAGAMREFPMVGGGAVGY